jgi:hypothetical protein
MRNAGAAMLVALGACAASPAFASGREGEAYVAVVLGIVVFGVIAFAGSMAAGIASAVAKARRDGALAIQGIAPGILKGLRYFLVVGVVTGAAATVLGFLWIVFALAYAPAIKDDCVVKGEPIQWAADYCMLKMQTDDEIAVADCIDAAMKKDSGSACDSTARFKRSMCEIMIQAGTRAGDVQECVDDPAFKGRTVEAGGVAGDPR